jgi:hypothetical protein
MTSTVTFTRTHLKQALTAEQLRVTAIIRIALMLGVSLFYLAIYVVFSLRMPDNHSRPDTSFMDILSVAHALFGIGAITAALLLSRRQLHKERLSEESNPQTPEQTADIAIGLHRVSTLLLMAPLEGTAFFGAAICMIGVQNGTMELYPTYWLNSASAIFLILVGLLTFPTRERVLATLESAFMQS